MRENTINHSIPDFDYIYINPDFERISEILECQNIGLKILVVFENNLERKDYFQTTSFFPFHFNKFPGRIKEYNNWQRIFSLAPHLFQAQKVFYPGKVKRQKYIAKTADLKFKNTYQKKFEIVNQKDEALFLNPIFNEGINFQEYRFNTSRFFIELLKYFQKCGGIVKVNKQVQIKNKKLHFSSAKKVYSAKEIIIDKPHFKTIWQFHVEVSSGFSMAINHNQKIFRFYENKNKLVAEFPEDYSEEDILNFSQNCFKINIKNYKKQSFPGNISTKTLTKIASEINQPLQCSFENIGFEGMYELCLEKYDLAKQTGIGFDEFKILFHRYGKEIEEMIENAYEKMNEIRNPKIIWETVEKTHQKKYEWKI